MMKLYDYCPEGLLALSQQPAYLRCANDTVVQHWRLVTNRDCIAVGLSFESPFIHACVKII